VPGSFVPGTRVYVGGVPEDITEEALTRRFSMYGEVLGLKVITGRRGGQTSAIIRFSEPAAADAAIAALKHKVDVRLAKPNPRWDKH